VLQPKYQIPTQARAQVFSNGHCLGRAVARKDKGKGLRTGRAFAPPIVKRKQQRLAFVIKTFDTIYGNSFRQVAFVFNQFEQQPTRVAVVNVKRAGQGTDGLKQVTTPGTRSGP